MNLNSKEIFALKDLLPYQEGSIVNRDIVNGDKVKFVLMSFDAGCALSEHAAPGEALIFALEGQNFKFDKNGMHSVKAVTPFKMALLLTL